MNEKTFAAELLAAVMFAAERHRNQRRKDAEASPYINHPIALAHLLATTGGVADVHVLRAAILHDTVEDTETTETELRERFGDTVAGIVMEVTDDKVLPKQRRKELQVEHAPHKSRGAALVKLADKTCNLRDIAAAPPADWSLSRRQAYFDWAKRVVDALPQVSEPLRQAFEEAYAKRPAARGADPASRDGHWLSMPGAHRGTSGFVRVMDSGDLEIELYDHSAAAESASGDEVSTIYLIRKMHLAVLADRLAFGFGGPVTSLAELPDQLTTFSDIQALIDWLVTKSGIPAAKRVDLDV
jgi:GTP diphosphokinase / guanosine-3',5'-bis(diphosphate) 3'-diphosphatase